METLSIIGSLCSILSLLISGFVAYKILNIEQRIGQSGNKNKAINQTAKGNGNTQIGKQ